MEFRDNTHATPYSDNLNLKIDLYVEFDSDPDGSIKNPCQFRTIVFCIIQLNGVRKYCLLGQPGVLVFIQYRIRCV